MYRTLTGPALSGGSGLHKHHLQTWREVFSPPPSSRLPGCLLTVSPEMNKIRLFVISTIIRKHKLRY